MRFKQAPKRAEPSFEILTSQRSGLAGLSQSQGSQDRSGLAGLSQSQREPDKSPWTVALSRIFRDDRKGNKLNCIPKGPFQRVSNIFLLYLYFVL